MHAMCMCQVQMYFSVYLRWRTLVHFRQRHNKDRWTKRQRTICATEATLLHFLIVTVSRSHLGIFHCTDTLLSETAHVTWREQDLLIHAHDDGENKSWYESQSPHNVSSCSLRRLTSAIDPLRGRFLKLRCSAGLHLLSLTLSAVNKAPQKRRRLFLNLAQVFAVDAEPGPEQYTSRWFKINGSESQSSSWSART